MASGCELPKFARAGGDGDIRQRFRRSRRRAPSLYRGFRAAGSKDIADCVAFALAAPVAVNIGNIEITPTLQVPGGLSTMRPGDRES
jgi:hypothetical protein